VDDVVVVGAGPAGLAAGAACAAAGLRVAIVTPDPDAPWTNSYGVWEDELPAARPDGVEALRWTNVTVELGDRTRVLDRAYARLANDRLQHGLRTVADRHGGRAVAARVSGVTHDARGSRVATSAGDLAARVVVDASGHSPTLLRRGAGPRPAQQTAYGIVGEFAAPPGPPGGMLLMDWRDEPLRGLPRAAEDPTFLYAMDLGDGRWLAEETSLARRPALGMDVLRDRLHRRLDVLGARALRTDAVERVAFPMGVPLPPRDQRVVGYGGAAGMVHPATGYQVAAALRRAPDLAAALVRALDDPATDGAAVARAGWAAVWPRDLVRQRALHEFGLETLLRFDGARTRAFFRAFFDLRPEHWRSYLSGAPSTAGLARTMLRLFATAPADLRASLVTGAFRPGGSALLRAAW